MFFILKWKTLTYLEISCSETLTLAVYNNGCILNISHNMIITHIIVNYQSLSNKTLTSFFSSLHNSFRRLSFLREGDQYLKGMIKIEEAVTCLKHTFWFGRVVGEGKKD